MDLFYGFLLGIPASMIASIVLGPMLEILAGYHVIRFLHLLRSPFRGDDLYDGRWEQRWFVKSDTFPPENRSKLSVYKVFNLVAADFTVVDKMGLSMTYRAMGRIAGEKYLTGQWMAPHKSGYHGPFQLIISQDLHGAEGQWMGFSKAEGVKGDRWIWSRCRPQ